MVSTIYVTFIAFGLSVVFIIFYILDPQRVPFQKKV